MAAKPFWFAFNTADWLSSPDVRMMSLAERGAYIGLLALGWESTPTGHLPADEKIIRRMAEMSPADWAESGDIILKKFPLSECGAYRANPRQMEEVSKRGELSDKKAEAGRKSAEAQAARKAEAERLATERQQNGNTISTPVDLSATGVIENANQLQLQLQLQAKAEREHGETGAFAPETVTPLKAKQEAPKPTGPPFGLFWDGYAKKRGDKARAERLWKQLPEATRQTVLDGLSAFLAITPDVKFRPDPATFLQQKRYEADDWNRPMAPAVPLMPPTPLPPPPSHEVGTSANLWGFTQMTPEAQARFDAKKDPNYRHHPV